MAVTGLVVAGLGAYFVFVDEARATVQATILGALAQVAGLGVAGYACWLTARTSPTAAASVHVEQHITRSRLDHSTVIGSVGTYSASDDERTTL